MYVMLRDSKWDPVLVGCQSDFWMSVNPAENECVESYAVHRDDVPVSFWSTDMKSLMNPLVHIRLCIWPGVPGMIQSIIVSG